ncbi:TetR/AcrR family transcriptional regulator [Roseibium salinum]|uniref:TetR/AcrR family transcriptional regulator n=1 Tax=Roseibium salinum TaxID=1604349 RepID=A0ABT3QYM3_9HYPH|nr:TetR/AcrR family transcriptional regulator [Roseibium sp. DSM 29163]MCX2721943.1 TetR/AcrR family transcriptional regulator [Roseibium sp. DSM 29163]MDN3720022.1 TetR/AcrR family transcriptional regulator [Roseibium salinum]
MRTEAAGRPRESRVTSALLEATLSELAAHGYEKTTIAAVAARAQTSKQAVYRRYGDKASLVAAAVEHGLEEANPAAPQRGSVAEDLRQCLTNTATALQDTPLGGAVRALVPHRHVPALASVFDEAENRRRLIMRQIFIATPFEADMETRIDLLLGLIYFRLLLRNIAITPDDIETAIYLVLGLVAPRDPAALRGLPGV